MKPSYPEAVSYAARKGSILGLFTGVRGRGFLGSLYPAVCKERLVGSTQEPFAPLLCIEVNTTWVSPAWISALVNRTGRRMRRLKSLVGTSPRRFGGPSSACYIWLATEPRRAIHGLPAPIDPNPHAIPCNSEQSREQEIAYLCGICTPLQPSATTDRTLVMSRSAVRVRSSALYLPWISRLLAAK